MLCCGLWLAMSHERKSVVETGDGDAAGGQWWSDITSKIIESKA
jgi:hypothetical protein